MATRRSPTLAAAVPTPEAECERAHVDGDLLRQAHNKAHILLLATDGLLFGPGSRTHDEEALNMLAADLASDLAELDTQANGEPEKEQAAVEPKKGGA